MTVVAVGMVKDEGDVIGCTIRHLLRESVDRVIVADNLSTDATRPTLDLLAAHDSRITVVDDPEYGYYQSRKMSTLAQHAYEDGAEWVVPFDADEIIWRHGTQTVGGFLRSLSEDVGVVEITGWDYLPSKSDDPQEPCPFHRIARRRDYPQKLPKVAFRATDDVTVHMGNHDVGGVPGRRTPGLELAHFQYRTVEQMTQKLRNGRQVYEATDIHEMHGTHWREGGALSVRDLHGKWAGLLNEETVFDPAPVRCQ